MAFSYQVTHQVPHGVHGTPTRAGGLQLGEGDAAIAADAITADTEGFLYAARLVAG